jgi:hypothetical protein
MKNYKKRVLLTKDDLEAIILRVDSYPDKDPKESEIYSSLSIHDGDNRVIFSKFIGNKNDLNQFLSLLEKIQNTVNDLYWKTGDAYEEVFEAETEEDFEDDEEE